jgi:hypothetical protein
LNRYVYRKTSAITAGAKRVSDPGTGGASAEPEVTFDAVTVSVVGLVSMGGVEVTAAAPGREFDDGPRRRRPGFG